MRDTHNRICDLSCVRTLCAIALCFALAALLTSGVSGVYGDERGEKVAATIL